MNPGQEDIPRHLPDLDQQIEYYTEVLGLTLVAKEKDAAFLALTLDRHSVMLRRGDHSRCVRIGFQIALDDDLAEFEKQTAAHGSKTQRRSKPEPSIADYWIISQATKCTNRSRT